MTAASKGEVEIELGGTRRVLSLKIGDFEELESRLNIGISEIIERMRVVNDGDVVSMPNYRLTDVRTILQLALEKTGWKGTRDDVLKMIMAEGISRHAFNVLNLLSAALGELPGGNAQAPVGGQVKIEQPASPSGAISNLAA